MAKDHNRIIQAINNSIDLKLELLKNEEKTHFIANAVGLIQKSIENSGKILICGNGGSAADSQHLAAEFIGRFMKERKALPAIALTTDTSVLTAVSNDYSFNNIFERQIEALCNPNDILIAISTSGNSGNVVNAIKMAKKLGAYCIALLGNDGGICKDLADISYIVSSSESARIQEIHLIIEHLICEFVENEY